MEDGSLEIEYTHRKKVGKVVVNNWEEEMEKPFLKILNKEVKKLFANTYE